MSITEITGSGILSVAALMTLVQIMPVKIDPWSALGKMIRKWLMGDIEEKIDTVLEQAAEKDARDSRYRILRFSDELLHNQKHTKEHFDAVLEEITKYDQYCEDHPKFKNRMTVIATQTIEETYKSCMEKRNFL